MLNKIGAIAHWIAQIKETVMPKMSEIERDFLITFNHCLIKVYYRGMYHVFQVKKRFKTIVTN